MHKKKFLRQCLSNNQGLFITFDDGPDQQITPMILDRFNSEQIKGSFFINLKNVYSNQYIVKRIIAEGHLLGIHSYSHLHPWKTNPLRSFLDLYRCDTILENIFRYKTKYFRPPYGKYNLGTLCYIMLFRKKVIFWNSDPKDFRIIDTAAFMAFKKKIHTYIGENRILLLHDKKKVNTFSMQMIDLILKESIKADIRIKKINC